MKKHLLSLLIIFLSLHSIAQPKHQVFEFEFEGVVLHGILNMPENMPPKGLVLIVHGSGETNAVAKEWHQDVREVLVQAGYGTYMYDKMGCGKSDGTFNYDQTVQNSAEEAIAAIETLKQKAIPGSEKIGLWGISRAGWICPIVINTYKDIAFWISVSGVDAQENFKYLLAQNLRINGLPKDSISLLVNEWQAGVYISHRGGDFEAYSQATSNLWANDFILRFSGKAPSEEGYYAFQKSFMQEKVDEASGLQVYVPGFEKILSQVNCPVLALFGEMDMHVDWKKTKALYEQTLSKHTDLTLQSFPACNHNMFQCKTGGFYEFQDNNLPWDRCDGFLDAMRDWLQAID